MPNEEGTDLSFVLNDLNARIRVLENKYSLFGERLLVINQNMIEEYKKLIRKNKTVDSELKELKKDLFNVKEVISGLVKELKLFAKKDNLKVLEKYINLWNPMNFVTEKDVINLIQENENLVSKKELFKDLTQQKKDINTMVKNELKESILTKKDVIDLIKKEGDNNSK